MNTNIINFSVEIQSGALTIIGNKGSVILFRVSGVEMIGDIDMSKIAKNWILTRFLGDSLDSLIFEHDIRGELRNPSGLMCAIRNKLMREISNRDRLFSASLLLRPDATRFRIIEDENRR